VNEELAQSMAAFIADHWDHSCGRVDFEVGGPGNWKLIVTTGGWSENEDIIHSIKDRADVGDVRDPWCLWWTIHWAESKRGGYFKFGCGPILNG
jgi:hypothetical protein